MSQKFVQQFVLSIQSDREIRALIDFVTDRMWSLDHVTGTAIRVYDGAEPEKFELQAGDPDVVRQRALDLDGSEVFTLKVPTEVADGLHRLNVGVAGLEVIELTHEQYTRMAEQLAAGIGENIDFEEGITTGYLDTTEGGEIMNLMQERKSTFSEETKAQVLEYIKNKPKGETSFSGYAVTLTPEVLAEQAMRESMKEI